MHTKSGIRATATEFTMLISMNRTRGFIDLVRPLDFNEQCAEQRAMRDIEETDGRRVT